MWTGSTKFEFNKLSTPDINQFYFRDDVLWKKGQDKGKLNRFTERVLGREDGPLVELKGHRLAEVLKLRTGVVVALVSNLDLNAGLCNGSQGVVVGFQPHDPNSIRSYTKSMGPDRKDFINIWIKERQPSG
jgi:ATP-dependent DNA helicase PIF1